LGDQLKTPVLLVAHRRPQETSRVVEAVLGTKPERVFIATDGPRADVSTDVADCARVREMLREASWPGDVRYLAQEENLGARRMMPTAIDWAFREVDRLIILEDDCLPHRTFFRFCGELLERYQAEPKVMDVAGTNPAPWRGGPSFRFSTYGSIWGWATWAASWRHFWQARKLVDDRSVDLQSVVDPAWREPEERDFWEAKFREVRNGHPSAWDYEWLLARSLRGGLAAMPRRNLVTNIGFGRTASTTATGYNHPIGQLRSRRMAFPLIEPDGLRADRRLDDALRASYLWTDMPGFRARVRRAIARVRGKIEVTVKRELSK
jgi:hypothetical protein